MCMEKLSHKIQSKVHSRVWKPFRISRGGLALSHLFFAYDLMLLCEASIQQVKVAMDCLIEFSNELGLAINLTKSKLYVSPNIQRQVAAALSQACGIPLTRELGNYLGVPILHGRPSDSTYKHLLEKNPTQTGRLEAEFAKYGREKGSSSGCNFCNSFLYNAVNFATI
ncbi:hypothetical protein SLE2022_003900 [Rubroshorea leprosula]